MKRLLLLITLLVLIPSVGWGACSAGSGPDWSNTDHTDSWSSDGVDGHNYQKVKCSSSVTIGKITLYVSNNGINQNSSLQILAADDDTLLGTSNTVLIQADAPAGTIKTYEFSTPVTVAEDFKVVFICPAAINVHFAYTGTYNQYFGGSAYNGYDDNVDRNADWAMTIYFGTDCSSGATTTIAGSTTTAAATTTTTAVATTTVPQSGTVTSIPVIGGYCGAWGKTSGGASPWQVSSADGAEHDSITSANVAGCVTNCSAGDTIVLPEGTATWGTNAVTVPATKPLYFLGSGVDKTVITMSGNYAFVVGEYVTADEVAATRIAGIKFISPGENKYAQISVSGQGWRIDHCYFDSQHATAPSYEAISIKGTSASSPQPFGLIDYNTFIMGKTNVWGMSNNTAQCQSWYDALGLGTTNAVYYEHNTVYTPRIPQTLVVDGSQGAKYVVRYNTLYGGWVMAHGTYGSGAGVERGTKSWEVYGNIFDARGLSAFANNSIDLHSGTGAMFNNANYYESGSYGAGIQLSNYRGVTDPGAPLGLCSSSNDCDTDETLGLLCRDQVGSGSDASLWTGNDAIYICGAAPAQARMPAYFFNNTAGLNGADMGIYNTAGVNMVANRDYYKDAAVVSDEQKTGVGCGEARPSKCVKGTAFWETAQSCTDLTGLVGADATAAVGKLYKCTATNTWTEYYVPLGAHPLASGNITTTSTTAEVTTTTTTAPPTTTTTALPPECLVVEKSVEQGATGVTIEMWGTNTNFENGITVMTISGTGITVGTTVVGFLSRYVYASIDVAADATLGARTVTITTGTEVVECVGAITIISAPTTTAVSTSTTSVYVPPITTTSTTIAVEVGAPIITTTNVNGVRYLRSQVYEPAPEPTSYRYSVDGGTSTITDGGRVLLIPLAGYSGTKIFRIKSCYGTNCTEPTTVTIKRCQCEGVAP